MTMSWRRPHQRRLMSAAAKSSSVADLRPQDADRSPWEREVAHAVNCARTLTGAHGAARSPKTPKGARISTARQGLAAEDFAPRSKCPTTTCSASSEDFRQISTPPTHKQTLSARKRTQYGPSAQNTNPATDPNTKPIPCGQQTRCGLQFNGKMHDASEDRVRTLQQLVWPALLQL